MSSLTVTEEALIDLQRQREAMMARKKQLALADVEKPEPGDFRIWGDTLDAMTRPVRLEIDFRDPIHARRQLDALMEHIIEAQMVSRDHTLGINRQRVRMRGIIKDAADHLTMMNGKTPAGRRRATLARIQDN